MSMNTADMTDTEFSAYLNSSEYASEEASNDIQVDEDLPQQTELEQPDDIDDSNNETDEETEDTVETEDSEENTDDQSTDEEETEETVGNTEESDVKVRTYKTRANGEDYEFNEDEVIKLLPKAIDYTKKMQEIAPYRKRISAMKDENITDEDFNLMMDVFKGNKHALASILKKTGIDAFELDTDETEYTPTSYGKDDTTLALEEITANMQKDPEYDFTRKVVDQQWDNASRDMLLESIRNPNIRLKDGSTLLEGLHEDIKNGNYAEVAPMATKLKILDGGNKSDLTYYLEAAATWREGKQNGANKAIQNNAAVAQVKAKQSEQAKINEASGKRKAAAPTKSKAGKRDIIDYLDTDSMSDAEFSKFMDKRLK